MKITILIKDFVEGKGNTLRSGGVCLFVSSICDTVYTRLIKDLSNFPERLFCFEALPRCPSLQVPPFQEPL